MFKNENIIGKIMIIDFIEFFILIKKFYIYIYLYLYIDIFIQYWGIKTNICRRQFWRKRF